MFTSEPTLAQRIERMIGDVSVIDGYCRVPAKRPGVSRLAGLLAEPEIQLELRGVGMPADDIDLELDSAARGDLYVANAVPYLARIRNTSAAWCFYRILRDLYDFTEPNLEKSHVQSLDDRISRAGAEPGWAQSVMEERAKLRAIVTSDWMESSHFPSASTQVVGLTDLSRIVGPALAAGENAGSSIAQYYDGLVHELGDHPGSGDHLRTLVFAWLDRSFIAPVKAFRVSIPEDFGGVNSRFRTSELSAILTRLRRGDLLENEDACIIANALNWFVIEWAHEHKRALQVEVVGGASWRPSSLDSRWARGWKRILRDFNKARFAFVVVPPMLSWEACLVAREFPNAYIAGSCREAQIPAITEGELACQIQAVSMTKIIGFSSGSSTVEWAYGRLQSLKKAMAGTFAGLVERRYYEEDEIALMLQHILYETPRDLYRC